VIAMQPWIVRWTASPSLNEGTTIAIDGVMPASLGAR
jgi:hypothetical protein